MNKGVKLSVFILIVFILSMSLAVAAFSYKSNNLQVSYSAGEKISGKLNISFSGENADSLIRSNFNGEVKLIDLLELNQLVEGVDYTCTYLGCFSSYKSSGDASGTLSLSENSPLIVGFRVFGEAMEISSLKFSISSDAGRSCSRQLLIDILDKNETFAQNIENSGFVCGGEYVGCFNAGANTILADITTDFYCEKITLPVAPAFKIGATVKNGTSPANLKMSLKNFDWQDLEECDLPAQTLATQQLGCIVNYSATTEGEYFVCISADSDDAGYQIKTEEASPACGTSTGGEPYNIDFDIYANPIEFAAFGNLEINDGIFEGGLVDYANSYINEAYQGNCSNGCIIPFRMTGISQDLTFTNAELKYRKGTSPLFTETKLYKFDSDKSKITTLKPVNLEMSYSGITIPLNSNASKLYLYINDAPILPAPIDITVSPSFGFDISPKTIWIGARNDFTAITSQNITSSVWNFGDGSSLTTNSKNAAHRYSLSNKASYKLDVTLVREDGVQAKNSFNIAAGSLKTSAERLIAEYTLTIGNLSSQIEALSPFVMSIIKTKFNTTEMSRLLDDAKRDLGNASSDSGYSNVIIKTLLINPPASIAISEEGRNVPLRFGLENANIGYLEQISGTTLDSESARENLKGSISSWLENNYDARIDYEVVSTGDDNNQKTPVLTRFKVNLVKKQNADESANEAYLIINYPKESIKFFGDYSEKTVGSGTYISIADSTTIEFIVSDYVSISSLGIYLSPQISKVLEFSSILLAEKGRFNWGRFIFWMLVLLIVAFAAYIALQEWYKRRYESYLFKSPVEVYNIITFMHNSRKNNLEDSETATKLKNAGWKGEQINYAFNKLDGKRTGMWEIPIFSYLEQRKIKNEIEKRRIAQQQSQDAKQQQTKPLLK